MAVYDRDGLPRNQEDNTDTEYDYLKVHKIYCESVLTPAIFLLDLSMTSCDKFQFFI